MKHYSSGMYVRLGFAVAVNLDPDVLLVDEVLAVGDEVFQAKCIGRIRQFQDEGRTIVFVTHDVETVRQVCSRAIVLDHGQMVIDGEPGKAIRVFREYLHGRSVLGNVAQVAETPLTIADVRVTHANIRRRAHLLPGESFSVEVDVVATDPVAAATLAVEICASDGTPIFKVSSDDLGTPLPPLDGTATLRVDVAKVDLLDGQFPLNLTLSDRSTGRLFDWRAGSTSFEVVNPTRATGLVAFDVSVETAEAPVADTEDAVPAEPDVTDATRRP